MLLSVSHDLDRLHERLTDMQRRQLPFAIARALTRTAAAARAELVEALPRYLDRPTPFIARSPRFRRATKSEQSAAIFLERTASSVLDLLIRGGGVRLPRPGRVALLEPGHGLRLDRYGNVIRSPATRRPRAAEAANTFVGQPKGHPGSASGIWQRHGGRPTKRIRLLLAFRQRQHVRKSLPFYQLVQVFVAATIRAAIQESLEQAVADAARL